VGLAGAGVADQAERFALLDPLAGRESVDGGGVDVGASERRIRAAAFPREKSLRAFDFEANPC
jgi:hypothetical protein